MAQVTLPSPSLSLRTYLHVIRRRRRLIVLITVLVAVFATLPAMLAEPYYAATSKVLVGAVTEESIFEDEEQNTSRLVLNLNNETGILTSKALKAEVSNQLPGATFEGPEVVPVGVSENMTIRIEADDPVTAADVANTYADVFVENRRMRLVSAIEAQEKALRGQSADASAELEQIIQQMAQPDLDPSRAASLQLTQARLADQIRNYDTRADQKAVDAALRAEATQVLEYAGVQSPPIAPSPLQSGLIGVALGVLLGLAVAVVVDMAQDRISSEEDLESVDPDTPVLTTVPHTELTVGEPVGDHAILEAFRYLKTAIRLYALNTDVRSVIVTSAIGSEGKTTTAALLAREMSDAAERVVLIDCDLRRPTIHEHFGIENEIGLTSLVLGEAQLGDAIHFVQDNLAVVPAGPAVHNPTEMMGSKRFGEIIRSIVEQADFTILDSPPVLPVADTLIAGQLVDASLIVTRIGEVRRRSLRQLLRRLEEAEIPVVGFVANDLPRHAYYGDYQGYGYYEPTRTPATTTSES